MSLYPPILPPTRHPWSIADAFSFDGCAAWRRRTRRLIAERGPVEQAWTDNPQRWALAQSISDLVKQELNIPTNHFLPQDSLHGMIALAGGDGLDGVEMIMGIEDMLGIDIPEDSSPLRRSDLTYGEFLDYLLTLSTDWKTLPIGGPGSPEAQPCPTAWVFWEVRRFFRSWLQIDPKSIRPRLSLDGLTVSACTELNRYIRRRFGISEPFILKAFGILPFSKMLLPLCLVAVALLGWALDWKWALGLSVPGCVVGVIALRCVSWRCWPSGVVTLSDLIRWILQMRRSRDQGRRACDNAHVLPAGPRGRQ